MKQKRPFEFKIKVLNVLELPLLPIAVSGNWVCWDAGFCCWLGDANALEFWMPWPWCAEFWCSCWLWWPGVPLLLRFRDFDFDSLREGELEGGAGDGIIGGGGAITWSCVTSSGLFPLPRFLPCLLHGCSGVERTRTSVGYLWEN